MNIVNNNEVTASVLLTWFFVEEVIQVVWGAMGDFILLYLATFENSEISYKSNVL